MTGAVSFPDLRGVFCYATEMANRLPGNSLLSAADGRERRAERLLAPGGLLRAARGGGLSGALFSAGGLLFRG
jgi:hypothetical protein